MTGWICPWCDGALEVTDTNGAEYPEPLVETRSCEDCDYETTETLTA